MATKMFINLPVKNIKNSRQFFRHLGFSFNEQFSDDTATCLILGENLFAMLLEHRRFQDFTKKPISDARESTQVLLGLDASSREEVDTMVKKAVEAGGNIYMEPQDHGFMYGHSFADLDGHQWEIFYMSEQPATTAS